MEVYKKRIWELDFARGLALLLMVIYHLLFDLSTFYHYPIDMEDRFLNLLGDLAAILFILLSGISCTLSRHNIRRGIRILMAGLAITIITYSYSKDNVIVFGILHLLGTCILLFPLFQRIPNWALSIMAFAILVAGIPVSSIPCSNRLFISIGFYFPGFTSWDYYPLIPWMGIFLLGNLLGRTIYKNKRSLIGKTPRDNLITLTGRHTLPIYLLHQPILLGLLSLVHS